LTEGESKVKRIALMLSLAALVFTAGCDPGITIRQANASRPPVTGDMVAQPELIVSVGKFHTLAGSGWYIPEIRVTNMSESPITITGVEVVTRRGTYANLPRRPESYPMMLATGTTETMDVRFQLQEGLQKTFRKPARLHVHYRSGRSDRTASASIVGVMEAAGAE